MRAVSYLWRGRAPAPVEAGEVETARQWTLKLSVVEGSIWSIMAGFGDMFVQPFAIFLKAGNQAIALLSTMPALVGSLAQMVGAAWTDRLGRRRNFILPFATLQAFLFLPLFLVPYLVPGIAVTSVVWIAALSIIAANVAGPAWTSMMGEMVPEDRRGDYFGHRSRVIIMAIFGANLLAGGCLFVFQRLHHLWLGFALIFSIACVARLVSTRLLSLHYDPPYRPPPEAYFSFWDFIRRLPRSNFARFALYLALMMGAINVAAPFFAAYMLRDLHWSYAQFTLNNAMSLFTQFFMVRWWGRIGDRHGNRVVIVATSLILPVLPILWLFSTNFYYLLGVQFVAGIGWSGFTIATQNFTLDAVSRHKRARVASYMSILNGMFSLAGGSLLGAWLANHLPSTYRFGALHVTFASSLPGVFLISGLLRLLAVWLLLPRFKEVRVAETIHPATLILRSSGGQALVSFIGQAMVRMTRDGTRHGGQADGGAGEGTP